MHPVNMSQSFFQRKGGHSPALTSPDLLTNHKRADGYKKVASLEKKMEEMCAHIVHQKEVKDEEEAIKKFKQLVTLSEEVVAKGKELSRFKPIDPKEILRFVKSLPTDDPSEVMSLDEESDFLKIEEALADYEILPVKVSELNRVQLAVLWSQKEAFSPALFQALLSIRLQNLESQTRKKNKQSLRFLETSDALYKREPLEMCALIHAELLDECPDYTIALQKFTKRLQGIRDERFEKRVGQLSQHSVLERHLSSISQSKALVRPISDPPPSSYQIIVTLVKAEPLEKSLTPQPFDLSALPLPPQRPPSEHSAIAGPPLVHPPKVVFIDLSAQTMEWMTLFLGRQKDGRLKKDASLDDLWESGGGGQ